MKNYDVIIIGGGFYGVILSFFFKKYFSDVLIIEKENDIIKKASHLNQARIHNGYHYPRSYLTALRSHINFEKFIYDFKDSILDNFESLYAVSKYNSKINSEQFLKFCDSIGSPVEDVSKEINDLFNPYMIENIYRTKEYVFNSTKLREDLKKRIIKNKINLAYNTEVRHVKKKGNRIVINTSNKKKFTSYIVINCSYSKIDEINLSSGFNKLPLKYELAEIAILKLPKKLEKYGITIIDGPFFSLLPFPNPNIKLHTLTHVRYTPHFSWKNNRVNQKKYLNPISTNQYMLNDATRFIPIVKNSVYKKSIFEVKTLLLENEGDDGRPILFKKDYGIKNYHIILGGKIDNIYDIIDALKKSDIVSRFGIKTS